MSSKKLTRVPSVPAEVATTLRRHGILTCKVLYSIDLLVRECARFMGGQAPPWSSSLLFDIRSCVYDHGLVDTLWVLAVAGLPNAELSGAHELAGLQLPPAAVSHGWSLQDHLTKTKKCMIKLDLWSINSDRGIFLLPRCCRCIEIGGRRDQVSWLRHFTSWTVHCMADCPHPL